MGEANNTGSAKSPNTGRRQKGGPPTRKLNWGARQRARFRRGTDRVLAAEMGWSLALVLVSLALLATQRCGGDFGELVVGQAAPLEIVAPDDFEVVDQGLTEERREQARQAAPDVYVHDSDRGTRLSGELLALFEDRRQPAVDVPDGEAPPAGQSLPPEISALLDTGELEAEVGRKLSDALLQAMGAKVVSNKSAMERRQAIELIRLPGRMEERFNGYDTVVEVDQARETLKQVLAAELNELPRARRELLTDFAASFVDANVYLDAEAGRQRRESAAQQVPPVLMRVPRGHVLVKKGERVTDATLERLEAARGETSRTFGPRQFVGALFVVCLLAFFLYRYTLYHQRDFKKLRHLHALLVLMLLSMMLMTRAMLWLSGEVVEGMRQPFGNLDSYTYLIPLGAMPVLVTLLANGRIATVYSAFAALFFGPLTGGDYRLVAWAMLVQLSGVYAISSDRERSALLRAGLVVGGAGAVAGLALESLERGVVPLGDSLYGAGLAFLGGAVGVGLLVSFSLPILENLFHVLTDIRLLELSNVNNPLLSRLAVQAPGSYNHSLVVGTLAEDGARAIGANSLFCRVAAFYHDVGKITHAEYFVENQRGSNPHDRLSPSMSSLIIASHVKDGIKMAREAGLPEQIIDIIPQHHGTKLMTYFYEKAKSNTDPALGPVKQEDFRYPGPKPQTREAAIFMIADAVEAAARTIDEPTPNRLREMIRKVTNSIVLDNQLDECDLTFADLDRIQSAFHRLLVSMYHHRVDYPGFDFNKPRGGTRGGAEIEDRKVARSS